MKINKKIDRELYINELFTEICNLAEQIHNYKEFGGEALRYHTKEDQRLYDAFNQITKRHAALFCVKVQHLNEIWNEAEKQHYSKKAEINKLEEIKF